MAPFNRGVITAKLGRQWRRRAYTQSEFDLHCQVARWLDNNLKEQAWWTTFPAGGGGVVRGARLKKMGLKPGVPDILIVDGGKEHPEIGLLHGEALWIELKTKKGRISPEQLKCHEDLRAAGMTVELARSLAEVRLILEGWCLVKEGADYGDR